jgi:hypothetical protein
MIVNTHRSSSPEKNVAIHAGAIYFYRMEIGTNYDDINKNRKGKIDKFIEIFFSFFSPKTRLAQQKTLRSHH